MRELQLTFKLKPLTLNKAFGQSGPRRFPTKELLKQRKVIDAKCRDAHEFIFDFERNYSPYEHVLFLTIIIYDNYSKIFKKDGTPNKRYLDVDNSKKYLTDQVFKNFDKLDDSQVFHSTVIKKAWDLDYPETIYCLQILDKDSYIVGQSGSF